jgi:hypothetical protein
MAKWYLSLAALAIAFTTTQASAQQALDCKGEVAKYEPMVNSMSDAKQKQEAMKELTMAREMMAKNDEKGCMTHIANMRRFEFSRDR